MDQKSEQENGKKKISDAEDRLHSAEAALDHYEHLVINTKDLETDELLALAGEYTAYWLEFWVHSSDLAVARVEARPEMSINFDNLRDLIGEAEGALFAAQSGDYKGIKKYLRDFTEGMLTETPKLVQLKEGLINLEQKLPDRGSKFVPPPPSWQLPEYQVEKS